MKKSRKLFWIIEILLFLALILIFAPILRGSRPGRKKRVVCVVNDSSAQEWTDLYEGLQLSARRQGVEFVMADTEKFRSADDVREVIADEANDGIDALIVEQYGMDPTAVLPKTLGKKVPKVYLNGNAPAGTKQTNISFKIEWMMKKIIREMKEDASNDLSGRTAGLVLPNGTNPYFSDCRKRMTALMQREGIALTWTVHTSDSISATEKKLQEQERTDYIIAFDDDALAAAADCVKKAVLPGSVIYGVGNSRDDIEYLDSGTIKGLLVPDTFTMGYRAMEGAIKMLKHQSEKDDKTISARYFRQPDLFASKDNQGYLFPREQM